MAQNLDSAYLVNLYVGRSFSCDAFDARSFQESNAGSNNRSFWIRIFKDTNNLYNTRFEWVYEGKPYYEIVKSGIDWTGFGVSGTTNGACAGKPLTTYFRRTADDSLIFETVAYESCWTSSLPVTKPISKPAFSAIRYGVCK